MADKTKIFNEIVKIGSRVVSETDIVLLSKYASALSVLSSAMTLIDSDANKAKRLSTLAINISK